MTKVVIHVIVLCAAAVVLADQPAPPVPAALPHAKLDPGDTDHAAAVVDAYFAGHWSALDIDPPESIGDATFLRRASLALNGVPPSAAEVVAFVESTEPEKREAKVNQLLCRSHYADYWAFRLRHWIVNLRESKGQGTNYTTLYQYCREALGDNRGWDVIARDLLATQGAINKDGRANLGIFFDGEPNEYAEAAMRLFLGTNLACAQCHDDPYVERFTRESYWGLAAFFGRIDMWDGNVVAAERFAERFPPIGRSEASISTMPGGDAAIDGGGGENRAIADMDEGEVEMPDPQQPRTMVPTPFGGDPIVDVDEGVKTRRDRFADWVTGPERKNLARAAVNRFLIELVGRGFVDSYDGFGPDANVRHEPLLNMLSDEFVARQFDLKWLCRTIVLSCLFQRPHGEGPSAEEHWQWASRRHLNSDQWYNAVLRATGKEERVYELAQRVAVLLEEERRARVDERRKLLVEGAELLKQGPFPHLADRLPPLPDGTPLEPVEMEPKERDQLAELRNQYRSEGNQLQSWRKNSRMLMSATSEALLRMNSPLIATSLGQGGRLDEIASLPSPAERLNAAFLHALGRFPSQEERTTFSATTADPSAEKIGDLIWALFQSTEFQTY